MNLSTLREVAKRHPGLILKPYDLILECDGFEAICTFAEILGGTAVYVPSIKTIFQGCLEEEARLNYKGDMKAMARKYGLSTRTLHRAIHGK